MNNCYDCKYRKDVTGSAHSECTHPAFEPPANFMFTFALAAEPGLKFTSDEGVKAISRLAAIKGSGETYAFDNEHDEAEAEEMVKLVEMLTKL